MVKRRQEKPTLVVDTDDAANVVVPNIVTPHVSAEDIDQLDALLSNISKSFAFKLFKAGHDTVPCPLREHLETHFSEKKIQEIALGAIFNRTTFFPFEFRMLLFTMSGLCA
jgi:hypothetical protein